MPIANVVADAPMKIEIRVNPTDIVSIQSRLRNTQGRITPELWARAKQMSGFILQRLDALSPVGKGGDWRRGSPPIRGSHRASVPTPYYAVVYATAPHEIYVVQGFEPHMPPPGAWLGEPRLSYPMRKAVLDHGTPENPRDYWDKTEAEAGVYNAAVATQMAARLKP